MGACLSKCGLGKSQVCEDVYELHDGAKPTGAKWAEKRNKSDFIGKGNNKKTFNELIMVESSPCHVRFVLFT